MYRLLRAFLIATGVVACLSVTDLASADIKLPAIIGSNMVLQRDMPIRLWGWADPGEAVAVSFSTTKNAAGAKGGVGGAATTKADKDGRWRVTLGKLKAGGPLRFTFKGKNTVTLSNVMVGEVWVCSGQSNMAFPVSRAINAEQELASAKQPNIRLITVPRKAAAQQQDDFAGAWIDATQARQVAGFSAVGYFFGRELHKRLNVPIGLINTSYGGTRAEAWTNRQALRRQPSLKPLLDNWNKRIADHNDQATKLTNAQRLALWQARVRAAKAAGTKPPRRPPLVVDPKVDRHRPGNLYNAMLHPIIGYTIRGAIWYQGEANVGRAYQYRTIFPTMIADWRDEWGQGAFPFGFVQLAPYRYGRNRAPQMCAELWEAQLLTLKHTEHTGMAVITDIGNVKNIHPTNKQEVARRLALWARATVYGEKNLVYSGPIYKSHTVDGDRVVIRFDHVGGGLKSRDGKALTYFTIAGADKKFHSATVRIKGDTLVVHSDEVKQPAAVRFGWTDTAEPNFVNNDGLPASPFRTDDWKAVTRDNHY